MSRRKGKHKGQDKASKVMHEFAHGELHSGSSKGPVVKSEAQAKAIAMSEKAKAGQMSDEEMERHQALVHAARKRL